MRSRILLLCVALAALACSTIEGQRAPALPADPSPADEPTVLASTWHPVHGGLALRAVGRVLVIEAVTGGEPVARGGDVAPGPERTVLRLERLPDGARLDQALVMPWVGQGLAVALAVEHDGRLDYRYLVTRAFALGRAEAVVTPEHGTWIGGDVPWLLTDPIFAVDAAEAFRLVELSCPGGDSLAIGFRRGRLRHAEKHGLEQKLFIDTCPVGVQALQRGRSALHDLQLAR